VIIPTDPVLWTDTVRVARWLGPSVSPDDAFLADCVDAANAWAWRKRQEAGYSTDVADIPPSDDVTLGTTMYAGMLYRERGSDDSFASFDESAGFAQTGGYARVKQLLGIGRAQVDRPPPLPIVNLLRQPISRGRVWVP
jgi:hypothetical protein